MITKFGTVTLALVLCGCSAADRSIDQAGRSPSPSTETSLSEAPAAPDIVGEWERLQKCPELAGALKAAGMEKAVLGILAEDGWIPGVTGPKQIKNPAHPCMDAEPRMHSHFFTADGQFGSRDAQGQQVDDGPYQLVGDDTVIIGDVTFHYQITGEDTITFKPVIPNCAPKLCFKAVWSVAVAYPSYSWHRVP